MKNIVAALLLLISSGDCISQEEPRAFLSWYDGWGVHTVWGAGKVSGSFNGASVKCGDKVIPVRAIYDSHESDGNPLPATQTAEYARTKNLALLHLFETSGVKCIFNQAIASEA